MDLKEFFYHETNGASACKRCGAVVIDRQKHYNWHHSVDTIATTEVANYAASHTRP